MNDATIAFKNKRTLHVGLALGELLTVAGQLRDSGRVGPGVIHAGARTKTGSTLVAYERSGHLVLTMLFDALKADGYSEVKWLPCEFCGQPMVHQRDCTYSPRR